MGGVYKKRKEGRTNDEDRTQEQEWEYLRVNVHPRGGWDVAVTGSLVE